MYAPEISVLLFMCERQTLEKVWTQFCGQPLKFMYENGLCGAHIVVSLSSDFCLHVTTV